MGQYSFTPIDGVPEYGNSIQAIYDGVNLDEELPGQFETLNVTGRGIIASDPNYTLKVGADGAWLDSANIPPRQISVEARITGKDNADARLVFNRINNLLYGGVKELRFTDEPNYSFGAILSQVINQKEDSKQIIVELVFLCLDPWKYSDPMAVGTAMPDTIIYPTIPDQIKLTLTAEATQLKVTNPRTGKNIILRGSYSSGQIVTLEFGERPRILLNGASAMTHLDILSDFELFDVFGGDTLVVEPAGTLIEIIMRRRLL